MENKRPVVLTKSGARKELVVSTNYVVGYNNMLYGPCIFISVMGSDGKKYSLELSKEAINDITRYSSKYLGTF